MNLSRTIGKYSEDGEVIEFIGSFADLSDFKTLVEAFFVTDLG